MQHDDATLECCTKLINTTAAPWFHVQTQNWIRMGLSGTVCGFCGVERQPQQIRQGHNLYRINTLSHCLRYSAWHISDYE